VTRTHLDADELRERLPHRPPFVLMDGVEEIVPGVSGVGVKNITISDPVFAGHFPARAIYPGVLMIEASAHTCGVVEMASMEDDDGGTPQGMGVLAGVRKFSFKQMVRPGDQLRISVHRRAGLGSLTEYECVLKVGSRVVAEGSLALAGQIEE